MDIPKGMVIQKRTPKVVADLRPPTPLVTWTSPSKLEEKKWKKGQKARQGNFRGR